MITAATDRTNEALIRLFAVLFAIIIAKTATMALIVFVQALRVFHP